MSPSSGKAIVLPRFANLGCDSSNDSSALVPSKRALLAESEHFWHRNWSGDISWRDADGEGLTRAGSVRLPAFPSQKRKSTREAGFSVFGWGRGITQPIPGLRPSGSLRSFKFAPGEIVEPLRLLRSQGSIPTSRRQKQKSPREAGFSVFGWGRGIRTPADGVRVRSPTTRRSPKRGAPRTLVEAGAE